MVPHYFGSRPGCMYCNAPRTEADNACAVASEVEFHWLGWSLGDRYDPEGHLQVLVAALRHRTREELTLELLERAPEVRFIVRRGPEIIDVAWGDGPAVSDDCHAAGATEPGTQARFPRAG